MKFPKRLKHRGRGKVLATIYGKGPGRSFYRLYWRIRGADGKRRSQMRDFATYSEARREGTRGAGLAKGLPGMALTPGQANDALAAFKALQGFYESTGKRRPYTRRRLSSAPLRSSWEAAPWAARWTAFSIRSPA